MGDRVDHVDISEELDVPSVLLRPNDPVSSSGRNAATPDSTGCATELLHDVELDPIYQRVVVDRTGMSGPRPKRLSIALTRTANVCCGHRREG